MREPRDVERARIEARFAAERRIMREQRHRAPRVRRENLREIAWETSIFLIIVIPLVVIIFATK